MCPTLSKSLASFKSLESIKCSPPIRVLIENTGEKSQSWGTALPIFSKES
jgi:hypothetical protein